MVRPIHDNHYPGGWALKDRTQVLGGFAVRGRAVSSRILGVGIVLVGVLLLAVGLIMGIEFPNYVRQQNKDKQCVVFMGHDKYQSWSDGSQYSRRISAYYWTLVNTDGYLYRGEVPELEPRGPYVYQEQELKLDVQFRSSEVSFRQSRQLVFDVQETKRACSDCSEDDALTILSPWYLQTVGQHGGEASLSWSLIPTYLTSWLLAAGLMDIQEDGYRTFRQNLSLLGQFILDPVSSVQSWETFSFGTWLRSRGAVHIPGLETAREGQEFTFSEIKALYKVLTNITRLGGTALSQPDFSLQHKCLQWALNLCSNLPRRSRLALQPTECGLVFIASKCQHNMSSPVVNLLRPVLCPCPGSCLNLTAPTAALYLAAISDFLSYVSSSVLTSFLAARQLDLVVSLNQSQLALGFYTPGDQVFPAVRVPGLLESRWVGEVSGLSPSWTVYTCLENRNLDNNMRVKEYNQSWWSPPALTRLNQHVSLRSSTDFVTSCPTLTACRSCPAPGDRLTLFTEELVRPTHFQLDKTVTLSGVRLHRYQLDPDTFSWSSTFQVLLGLQNMTALNGYQSWASLPAAHFSSDFRVKGQWPKEPPSSYVLVEPVTGRIWERRLQLQWNVGVSRESGQTLGRNISLTDQPLPLLWTDRLVTVSQDEVQAYTHLVSRLMAVSCGGLVGFTILASLVSLVGLVVILVPFKQNRVLPSAEDPSSLPNGRHL